VDLPTYTNIWRIEKRLYKLYDFRLPMPLPVGQIAIFLVIAVPYVLVLTLLGLPFSHTLLWVYVLPPGVLAWLTTRPVLESKRLPELVRSQVRYLLEPRTWCRMAPLAEKDEIVFVCRVWRQAEFEPASALELEVAPVKVPARRRRPAPLPLAIAARAVPQEAAAGFSSPDLAAAELVAADLAPALAPPVRVTPVRASSGRATPVRATPLRATAGRAMPGSQGRAAPGQAGLGQTAHGQAAQGPGAQHPLRPRPLPLRPLAESPAPERPTSWPQLPQDAAAHQPAPSKSPAHESAAHESAAHESPARESAGHESAGHEPSAHGSARQEPAAQPARSQPTWPQPAQGRHAAPAAGGSTPARAANIWSAAAHVPQSRPASGRTGEVSRPGDAGRPGGADRPPADLPEGGRPAAAGRPVIPGHLTPPAEPPAAASAAEPFRPVSSVPAARPAERESITPTGGTAQPAEIRPPARAPQPAAPQPPAPQSVTAQVAAHQPGAPEPVAAQQAAPEPVAAQSAVTNQSAVTGASPVVRQPGTSAASPLTSQPHGDSPPPAGQTRNSGEKPGNAPPSRPARPVVTVTGDLAAERPLRVVERALRSQPGQRPDGWRDRVVVVPGGHRPGKPDQLQRDRARARLQVEGSRRIVVLGCTRGAGQTTTTLLAGDTLASLRGEPVAVLDLNPGRGSLTEQAAAIPGLMQDSPELGRLADPGRPDDAQPAAAFPGHGLAPGDWPLAAPVAADAQQSDTGLQVISGSASAHSGDDAGRLFDLVAARYRLTFADPAAGCVPRTLDVADQLLIVAPASAEAANALAMTFEWLEAHGHGRLAAAAITVLNGVSGPTRSHVEHAAAVASGRCRAIVKVPWDSHLKDISRGRGAAARNLAEDAHGPGSPAVLTPADPPGIGLLSPALMHAYTALAGVLIAGLAQPGELRSAGG
jgi:hypothetical protein